jgi:hypothetical protein
MSVGTLSMAVRGFVFNNKLFSMNLFRFVYFESIQRGSLAAIRYAARAVRIKLFFRASSKIL